MKYEQDNFAAVKIYNDKNQYLWNGGTTFPSDSAALANMFSDGELLMDISYEAYSIYFTSTVSHFHDTSVF